MAEGDPKDLDARREETLGAISSASDIGKLEDWRVRTLGKSGWLTDKLKELGKLAAEQRKEVGKKMNALKDSSADAWDDVSEGTRKAASELKQAFEKAKEKFK